jgi:hypothetical protein
VRRNLICKIIDQLPKDDVYHGSVSYHNSLYALWLQHCLIFHIRKKKCDIVKVLKKGLFYVLFKCYEV